MGRYVYENNEYVWKYEFAKQASEQCRIAEEFNIGHIRFFDYEDHLTLHINDVEKLEKVLEEATDFELAVKERDKAFEPYEKGIPFDVYDKIDAKAKENCNDIHFYRMIKAYIKHMKKEYETNNREEFLFIGEY